MIHKGSCLCRKVKYEVVGDFEHFFLCHCGYCQKGSGSAHASNLFAPKAVLKWLSGENLVAEYHVPNSQHFRSFCKECGAPLPNLQMDGSLVVVPAGSLDNPEVRAADGHIFVSKRAKWDSNLHQAKEFEEFPE